MTRPRRIENQTSVRKSWILDKAGTLFWQKGYHSTSMRDIAKACKCKASNIYNYFAGKEDILFEVIRDITEHAVDSIQHLENDETTEPAEQLRSLIESHFGMLVRMKRSSVLISDSGLKDLSAEHRKAIIRLRDTYDEIMRRVIRRGIEKGVFTVSDEKVAVYFISSVILRSTLWFSPKGRLSADQIAAMMFEFVYGGIRTGEKNSTRPSAYDQVIA
jgi:AcrR family transcriptional regulator